MSITLSKEQIAYLEASGKVVLNACPGSGKTTTVAHKLNYLMSNWDKNFSKKSGILCLSFTNVAKNEIFEKFREINGFPLPYPHVISTIDSFVNSYITLPFAHKIKNVGKRYHIIDDMKYLTNVLLSNWELNRKYGQMMRQFDPSKLDYTLNNGILWDKYDKSAEPNFVTYGKAIKKQQFSYGLLKTSDSAFFAYHILKEIPRIAKYLTERFSYLIIDEAQDTSEIQHAILEILYNQGLKHIDLVGDPYQCLYQWRNASPELFFEKFDDKANWQGIDLTENRRSTRKIIDVFRVLRRCADKAIVPINDTPADLPLHIIKYDSANYPDAIRKYEQLCKDNNFSSNSILVRGNALKNRLQGKEENFSPWQTALPYLLIDARIHLQSNETKEAVRKIRRILIELLNPGILFSELKEKEGEFKNDKEMNAKIFRLIRELPQFDLSLTDWTMKTQQYLKNELKINDEPDFQIRKNNTKTFNKASLINPVNKYFKKATTDNNLPITTIHQVKGKTFESVFLILNEKNHKENITLKDLELKEAMPTEKQRLIYVAMSRPKKLLCIGVPNKVMDEDLKKQFGNEIVIL